MNSASFIFWSQNGTASKSGLRLWPFWLPLRNSLDSLSQKTPHWQYLGFYLMSYSTTVVCVKLLKNKGLALTLALFALSLCTRPYKGMMNTNDRKKISQNICNVMWRLAYNMSYVSLLSLLWPTQTCKSSPFHFIRSRTHQRKQYCVLLDVFLNAIFHSKDHSSSNVC